MTEDIYKPAAGEDAIEAELEAQTNKSLIYIKASEVYFGDRERPDDDYGDLKELAESMACGTGTIQSIAVEEIEVPIEQEDGGVVVLLKYQLLAGGRRVRAALKYLPVDFLIPAQVYNGLNDYERKFIELEENVKRKDFSWATMLKMREDLHNLLVGEKGEKVRGGDGHSIADTAALIGMEAAPLSNDLKLAKAIRDNPEIAKARTKEEAMKLANKKREEVITAEIARREKKKVEADTTESSLKRLVKCYIKGNFFEQAKKINDTIRFNMVEVDPPYGIDYEKISGPGESVERDSQISEFNEWDQKFYEENLRKTMETCYALCKDTAWAIIWHSVQRQEETRRAVEAAGWKVGNAPLIWTKPKIGRVMNPSNSFCVDYEFALYARKGDAHLRKQGPSSLFQASTHSKDRIHPTEKPIEVLKDMLNCFCVPGDLILSPFLGSGNICLAANDLQMTAIGFDLSEKYQNGFVLRAQRYLTTGSVGKPEEESTS